jgi:hypothetical protein
VSGFSASYQVSEERGDVLKQHAGEHSPFRVLLHGKAGPFAHQRGPAVGPDYQPRSEFFNLPTMVDHDRWRGARLDLPDAHAPADLSPGARCRAEEHLLHFGVIKAEQRGMVRGSGRKVPMIDQFGAEVGIPPADLHTAGVAYSGRS